MDSFMRNDNNLNARYTNLINSDYWGSLDNNTKEDKVNELKTLLDGSDINLESIKTLTGDARNKFKNLLTTFENEKKTVEKNKKQEQANKEFGEQQAKKQEDIIGKSLLQDGNMELGKHVNTLVFFGTGTGGKSLGRDVKMDDVMLMKNSTYYACITGNENKEISSLSNNPEVVDTNDANQTARIKEIIKRAKEAFVSIEKSKEEDRSKLNEISNLLKGDILPKGINIDFSNRTNQSIQMIFGFTKNSGNINADGRIQFVPRIGNIKSSVIKIRNNEYTFDSSDIEGNQQDQSVKQVVEKLIGRSVKPKESVITGGKKRNTYRKKKTSKGKRSKVAKKTRKTRRKTKH